MQKLKLNFFKLVIVCQCRIKFIIQMLYERSQQPNNLYFLQRENAELRQQLRQANITIAQLRQQIQQLQSQSSKHTSKQQSSPQLFKTPKMKMEQQFIKSSDQEQEPTQEGQISPASPISKIKNIPLSHSSTLGNRINAGIVKKPTKVIFNENQEYSRKSILHVLKKSTERKKQNGSDKKQDGYKCISSRQIPLNMGPQQKQITSIRSQKVLFRKVSNQKQIFDCFFVTGITREGPCISYSYPHGSNQNFEAYLSLLYSDSSMKQPDLSSSSSKSKINISLTMKQNQMASLYIRDTFIIPIMKASTKNSQKDYLFVCEVEEDVIQKQYTGWHFPRFYCFVSQWKFFKEFKGLISQLIDRIHLRKRQYSQDNLSELTFTKIVQQQIEKDIKYLHEKTIDYNKTLTCSIGNPVIRFTAELPPQLNSYLLLEDYKHHKVLDLSVQFRIGQDEHPSIETKLMGVLLAYALAEVKMVLYSTVKSKVSEAILQLLQIMKPLTYVNPIILTTLKDEHQDFLGAPMSIILGLWSQQRKSNKQKIQIFMNKKLNLMGLIQKAKLSLPDGIIINLDTGLVFGGGIDSSLTDVAIKFNKYRQKLFNNQSKNIYKIIEKLLLGKYESQQAKQMWMQMMVYLKKTQVYQYYLQNRDE